MKVKLDTKEKFSVITVLEPILSANMTEDINEKLLTCLKGPTKNIVLNLKEVNEIDKACAEAIVNNQQIFYEHSASFLICEMQKPVEKFMENLELLEIMNITKTESEAWDIVQMEEIEREMFDEE